MSPLLFPPGFHLPPTFILRLASLLLLRLRVRVCVYGKPIFSFFFLFRLSAAFFRGISDDVHDVTADGRTDGLSHRAQQDLAV